MKGFKRITFDPNVMGGQACIRGMRIPVSVVVSQVAHGASFEEILEVMDDLRAREVDVINIGQYLQPTRSHASVKRYWHPNEFTELKHIALAKGFLHCEAGPLVRSSYHADE